MFGNKILLKWKEPRYLLKYGMKQMTAKDYLAIYVEVIWKWVLGSFIVISYLRWSSAQGDYSFFNWETFAAVAAVVVIFTVLWLILMLADPPQVKMREKDVKIVSPGIKAVLSYEEMQCASIGKVRIEEEREFYALEIKHRNGEESFIEIAPPVNTENITEILKSKNVQVTPSMVHQL